ncbi:AhpC/TSA family protein [Sphingobacterium psychroaquaticum]|uniref:peroxiredoxin-like family protein n=1 Tax=Sphingobacterium psychroaquaticum TaxID=561061 RepID=UPI00106C4DD2|nr:peroxiredoxin-like family protein [Sphingobacterium psychroaquaticum]QBQ41045.1 AhpC/TSA family protein [Sphingobacterium psychroaquaticum]
MKKIAQQIEELNENLAQQLPREILEVFAKSIADLKTLSIEDHAIKTGDKFPDFSLPNTNDKNVSLKELLKRGKVIIAFFRGSWCPYCNIELKTLQDNLKQITDRNATLVAISPQTSYYNEELKNNHHLDFELVTDKNNALAKQLGISFELQDFVIPAYRNLGIDLSEYNKNNTNELPTPAIFVLDPNGTITYRFVDTNYMNRIDMQQLIEQL